MMASVYHSRRRRANGIFASGSAVQAQLVSQHGDKLSIGGLILRSADAAAQHAVERIHPAAVPCDFNRVANGAFDLAGGRGEVGSDGGVQLFGDTAQHTAVAKSYFYCFAQILIAFYMSGDAYREENTGNALVVTACAYVLLRQSYFAFPYQIQYSVVQQFKGKRFFSSCKEEKRVKTK